MSSKAKTDEPHILDFFGYYYSEEEKTWYITKNGDNYLKCCGSESEAMNIVGLLS